jgi:hypothetical protein
MTTTTSNPFAGTRIATGTPTEPEPTDAQANYVRKLADDVYGENAAEFLLALEEGGRWTKREISKVIDSLRSASKTATSPRNAKAQAAAVEGFHFLGGKVYKVQANRAGTAHYAKVLDSETGSFEYAGAGPLRLLSEETLLTLDQAAEFGKLYGRCARCGATLTDEDSIERGIGPICATKF